MITASTDAITAIAGGFADLATGSAGLIGDALTGFFQGLTTMSGGTP